ncbi:uncharacterized protein LOC114309389 [Camellia sinensis]|uniref:uncharacterized protein LOC114309389 n=1 Tax=Camellia sinensis TaxID=4442 RepID=UPI0010362BF5|nr:uncharacterized protein LOC114309389 [Camellia sinensis]XP_028110907.1 uncharacterized protein LOC114309389 [Camellia sinensis]
MDVGLIRTAWYDSRNSILQWSILLIDNSNRSGSMEFVVPPVDASVFFPISVRFTAASTFSELKGIYVLSNVAFGNEFHKEAVMDQLFPQIGDNIQSIMIKLLQSNDSRLRTACVWTVLNLTFPSSPAAHSRVAKLQNACITSQLKDMVNDPCLDVKVVNLRTLKLMQKGQMLSLAQELVWEIRR